MYEKHFISTFGRSEVLGFVRKYNCNYTTIDSVSWGYYTFYNGIISLWYNMPNVIEQVVAGCLRLRTSDSR